MFSTLMLRFNFSDGNQEKKGTKVTNMASNTRSESGTEISECI